MGSQASLQSRVPGAARPAGDRLQRPRLLSPVPRYLERLSVRLHPSLEEFEEELLDLLNSDRLLQVLPRRSRQGQRRHQHRCRRFGYGWRGEVQINGARVFVSLGI